jgi:hypothetical protein
MYSLFTRETILRDGSKFHTRQQVCSSRLSTGRASDRLQRTVPTYRPTYPSLAGICRCQEPIINTGTSFLLSCLFWPADMFIVATAKLRSRKCFVLSFILTIATLISPTTTSKMCVQISVNASLAALARWTTTSDTLKDFACAVCFVLQQNAHSLFRRPADCRRGLNIRGPWSTPKPVAVASPTSFRAALLFAGSPVG